MDSWQREFLIVLMTGDYNYLARNAGYVTLEDMAKILEDEAGIKIKGY